jgi:hypothetical protein
VLYNAALRGFPAWDVDCLHGSGTGSDAEVPNKCKHDTALHVPCSLFFCFQKGRLVIVAASLMASLGQV